MEQLSRHAGLLALSFTFVSLITISGCTGGENRGDSVPQATNVANAANKPAELTITGGMPVAASTDWPWWQGPKLDNKSVATNVPLTWSDPTNKDDGAEEAAADSNTDNAGPETGEPKTTKQENIIWKAPVAGRGLSTPCVVGNQIFLTTADEEKQTVHMLCFARDSGELQWDCKLHEGGFLHTHKKNSQASPTAACDGKRVYVPHLVKQDEQEAIWVSAVDLDGNLVWQKKAGDFRTKHGYGSSPVIYGSLLIVSGDNGEFGFLIALDRETGETVWRIEREKKDSFATPTVAHLAGRDQLLIHGTLLVASYDPLTGKEIWRCDGPSVSAANTIVTDDKRVYASGGWPEKFLLAIRADGSGDVTETHIEWKKRKGICYVPTMLPHNGRLFGVNDDGIASCYDAETGDKKWMERLPGNFSASPVLVGKHLYIPNEAGKMYVIKAADEFEIVAENDLGDGGFATPVILGSRIYLRTDHYLYCIGSSS